MDSVSDAGLPAAHVPGLPQNQASMELRSSFQQFTSAIWQWISYLWQEVEPFVTYPVIILFILPVLMLMFVYFAGIMTYVYTRRRRIVEGLKEAIEEQDVYKAVRDAVSFLFDSQGWIFFGYEVEGLENIPDEGPAMLLYYHGVIPVDYYYLVAKVVLQRRRIIHSVVDNFLFRIWGIRTMLRAFHCTPGSQQSCSEELKSGHLIGLAPGGVYESLFGDNNYELMWRNRVGFAKIALNTKCKIIPVFTPNIRETFRTPALARKLLRPLYQWTRLPIMPIYGGFPVKLKTIIGKPIEYDPENCNAEELRDICKLALQKMIDDNQKKPGSILRGLWQRFKRPESSHVR